MAKTVTTKYAADRRTFTRRTSTLERVPVQTLDTPRRSAVVVATCDSRLELSRRAAAPTVMLTGTCATYDGYLSLYCTASATVHQYMYCTVLLVRSTVQHAVVLPYNIHESRVPGPRYTRIVFSSLGSRD